MKRKIFKFVLQITDVQQIEMQKGAIFYSVQVQKEQLCVWASVDPDAEKEQRTFFIVGTGVSIPENAGNYISTFQCRNGAFIGHLFGQKK